MSAAIDIAGLDRERWLALRRQGIGSSDAPAIAGFDRYRSPFAVYVDKIEILDLVDTDNAAMEWGRRLEQVVAEKFADEHPELELTKPTVMYRHRDYAWMLASPDRIVTPVASGYGEVGLLEVKTTSHWRAGDWSDGPPNHVLIQVQHQLAVTGLGRAWVAALVDGRTYREYEVARDDAAIDALIAVEHSFWFDHVAARVPPPIDGSESTADAIRALYAHVRPASVIELPAHYGEILDELARTRASIKDAKGDERHLLNTIQAALGENEIGLIDGEVVCTWKETTSRRVNVERLRELYPDAAADCTELSRTRRFLLLKGPTGE